MVGERAIDFITKKAEESEDEEEDEVADGKLTQDQLALLENVFKTLNPVDNRVDIAGLQALYLALGIEPSEEALEVAFK